MQFNLFNKKKQPQEAENPAIAEEEPQPKTQTEAPTENPPPEAAPQQTGDDRAEALVKVIDQTKEPTDEAQEQPQPEPAAPSVQVPEAVHEPEQLPQPIEPPVLQPVPPEVPSKTYLKAMPLRELSDVETVKNEVENGNIIILKVTPLASKSIEDVKTAVNDLYEFAESSGGDIARLGEERVVICPKSVRIWREKTPAPVATGKGLPSSAA